LAPPVLEDELLSPPLDEEFLPPDKPPPLLETAGGVGSSLLLSLQALNVNVMANITIAVKTMGRLTLPLRVDCVFILNLRFVYLVKLSALVQRMVALFVEMMYILYCCKHYGRADT
jgi:hypothetical protein